MPTINDRSIRAEYSKLKTQFSGTSKASVNDIKDLLANIADRAGLTMTGAKEQIKNAVSTQELMSIVKEGMSGREKTAIEVILDDPKAPLADDAKKFLEQLVGRTPVNPTTGPVNITGMKLVNGKVEIEGTAKANVTVEALNLSLIPTMRLHDDDTFLLGKTDGSGKLTGTTDLKGGDWLRIRTRDAQGNTSDWMVIRADQLGGGDKRNAEVALQRVELTDAGGGKIALANNNNSRPISEPFATLRFTNDRTGEKTDIKLDDTGRFPGVPKIGGKAGDTFTVAATDGRNNTDFRDIVGKSQVLGAGGGGTGAPVQIEDPKPHKDDRKPDGTSRYDLKNYSGPLFKDGAGIEDVVQGNIGDCYLPAAAASLAHARPDLLTQIIREATDADRKAVNADRAKRREPPLPATGKFYVVEFQQDRDGNSGKHLEAVDADFYTRSWGGPLYGASSNSTEPDKMELWWPLFEKAYAQLSGDYHNIGEGGSSADVFQAVMGRPQVDEYFSTSSMDACFRIMKDKLAKKLPVAMGTKDDKGNEAAFANSGIFGDHTYTVLDAFEKNGVKYVKLRNPWGESEPSGNGKNDGIFEAKLSDLPKWFSVVWSVQ